MTLKTSPKDDSKRIPLSFMMFLYLQFCFFIIATPKDASSKMTMPPVYHLLMTSIDSNQKIFIIGDSTVHRHLTPSLTASGIYCGNDNPQNELQGWADRLSDYMIHPENNFNRARQGASSEEYKTEPADPDVGLDRNWVVTRQMIQNEGGGILLIQFGSSANEKRLDDDPVVREQLFKENLTFYINEARSLNALPILVTPPEGRKDWNSALVDGSHPQSRIPYPQYIEDVAAATKTEVLDLTLKSNGEFAKYSDEVLLREFGDCRYSSGYWDRVHYEPQGAKKVAGWVKELACTQLMDKNLCAQFSKTSDHLIPTISLNGDYAMTIAKGSVFTDPGATAQDDFDGNISQRITQHSTVNTSQTGDYAITYDVADANGNQAIQVTRPVKVVAVHEDAEDGLTENWGVYAATAGSVITNEFDGSRQSRVIVLQGNAGLDNGFSFDPPQIPDVDGSIVSWSMNFNQAYKFMVKVRTDLHDPLYIYYASDTLDRGYEFIDNRHYVHTGLGTATADGTWRTFTRDIKADLKRVLPNDQLLTILGFRVRGSGRIDDITIEPREDQSVFYIRGNKYEIVKTNRSWEDARSNAHSKWGYLTTISSRTENDEIYSRLYRHIAQDEYANTISTNGGNASYVWIGATDIDTDSPQEGKWRWEKLNVPFWDNPIASPVDGRYNKWGRGTDENRYEPDNWGDGDGQDAAAMALTEWQKNNNDPAGQGALGQASQWNDLFITDQLYYIIEYE